MATIRFTAIAGGTTDISGVIVKIKDDSTTTEDAVIVAGTDQLVVNGDTVALSRIALLVLPQGATQL